MSAAWDAHYKRISDLIAANPVQRAPMAAPPPPTVQPGIQAMLPQGLLDMFSGGANTGMDAGQNSTGTMGGSGFGGLGGFPNANTISSALDINPSAARGAMTALGLLSGPVGMGISALNSVGNAVNTSNNLGMLSGLGVNPGFGSTIGGLLGFNGLSGNPTSALNAAMGNQYSGFANLSTPQFDGDLSGPGGWGGWGDIAAQMDQANAEAAAAGGTPSGPSGGMADRGDISSEQLGSFKMGGYTGAGRDGKVQPGRVAGIVHEGEYVIPHRVVRGLLAK
jgi:hypothetical protein